MDPEDIKIEVFSKDDKGKDADGLYCAIVLAWSKSQIWYNTGIVVREADPFIAFGKAMDRAKSKGWWK